ncbi:hypothetical protein Rsub_11813 [Raphidocelis subcapitata]|uniref:Condensin complex subunit 1 n=1 Tax=Raphidocelis subcapitata TaxID=307507 RepID=A0A2V0PHE7_9CHLO|nr:hypothetical protein Rsub_11813 [Raphidocelis subcapitata]|eukprot:GBF99009.1 hypothetical protein Rsub_11813 [Raphidocelis subcapitata]
MICGDFEIPTAWAPRDEEPSASALGVLQELQDNDALYIADETTFEQALELVSCFSRLPARDRTALVEALTSNLLSLAASTEALLEEWSDAAPDAVAAHKAALRAQTFLLHCVSSQASEEAERGAGAGGAAAAAAAPKGRGGGVAARRGRAAAADEDAGPPSDGWDWEWGRAATLRALEAVLLVDLAALFGGVPGVERMAGLALDVALAALESKSAAAARAAPLRAAATEVLCACALRYGQLEAAASQLLARARRADHVAAAAAAAAAYAEARFNKSQLAVALLCEFSRATPGELDDEARANAAAVTRLAALAPALAEAAPGAVANQISLLRPFLACSSASMRGAVLSAIGTVLIKVYNADLLNASTTDGARSAHLRSKRALMEVLKARALDKGAYVRQRVMQIWSALVEAEVVPIASYNEVLGLAISRLEDDSQLVVRAAIGLAYQLLRKNPFGERLATQRFVSTLPCLEARLAEYGGAPEAARARAGAGGAGSEGGAGPEGDEEMADGAAGDEAAEGEAGADAEAEADGDEGEARLPDGPRVSEVRHLIATVRAAVEFCRRLEGALPTLRLQLGSSSSGVVTEVIKLLAFLRRFQVPGAASALRGMWPLVFAREEEVRTAVLEAWWAMYLGGGLDGRGSSPKEQVETLLSEVVPGLTLGELSALGTILSRLAAPPSPRLAVGRLLGPLMNLLVSEFTRAGAGAAPAAAAAAAAGSADAAAARDQSGDGGAAEGQRRVRLAFQLLSLLAAASPADVLPHAEGIAAIGFSQKMEDPAIQRATCQVLASVAPCLLSGGGGPGAARERFLARAYEAIARLLLGSGSGSGSGSWGSGGGGAAGDAPGYGSGNWPAVAEAAVAALYALHPRPHALAGAVLARLARAAGLSGGAAGAAPSAAGLARVFTVLGAVALQQLALSERGVRAARAGRADASRSAAEAAADAAREAAAAGGGATPAKGAKRGGKRSAGGAAAGAGEGDDIAAQLGVGAAASMDELDALAAEIEGQISEPGQLLGGYTSLLSALCFRRSFLDAPEPLQSAALLALTKLMAIDGRLCAPSAAAGAQGGGAGGGRDHVALLFTLLLERRVPAAVRANIVTALGDLASRWPNALEPWTWAMYEPLSDPDPTVRSCCLSVLTHLVLGGRLKAKGSVAKVARLTADSDPAIAARARLFFSQLAKSGTGSARASASAAAGASAANPVYNLLPDMLSALCREQGLSDGEFREIMGELLPYVKDRQADALREKLALRMEHAPGGAREWRWLAFCLGQLGYSEKAARRLAEVTRAYKHALGEDEVYCVFKGFADKARKAQGGARASAPAASAAAAPDGPPAPRGAGDELRERAEEWARALDEARAAALEAKAVEEAAAARAAAAAAAAAAGGGTPGGGGGGPAPATPGGAAAGAEAAAAGAPAPPAAGTPAPPAAAAPGAEAGAGAGAGGEQEHVPLMTPVQPGLAPPPDMEDDDDEETGLEGEEGPGGRAPEVGGDDDDDAASEARAGAPEAAAAPSESLGRRMAALTVGGGRGARASRGAGGGGGGGEVSSAEVAPRARRGRRAVVVESSDEDE